MAIIAAMPSPRLIAHSLKTTAAGPRRSREIADDLLRGASRRLRILALMGAVLWFTGPQEVARRLAAIEIEPWTEAQAALWWKERA